MEERKEIWCGGNYQEYRAKEQDVSPEKGMEVINRVRQNYWVSLLFD